MDNGHELYEEEHKVKFVEELFKPYFVMKFNLKISEVTIYLF